MQLRWHQVIACKDLLQLAGLSQLLNQLIKAINADRRVLVDQKVTVILAVAFIGDQQLFGLRWVKALVIAEAGAG